jgi:hypothetical protein
MDSIFPAAAAMNTDDSYRMNRRGVFKGSAAALGGAFLAGDPVDAYPKNVDRNSSPSALKITGLRIATAVKPGPGSPEWDAVDSLAREWS